MNQSLYDQVVAFMQHHGQATPASPLIPDESTRMFRYDLMDEESLECAHAEDIIKALDGVADMLVVLLGTGAAYGFSAEMIEAATQEVCRSNATKGWTDGEVRHLADEFDMAHLVNQLKPGWTRMINHHTMISRREGEEDSRRWTVTRYSKVIKSPSYSPADIAGVLRRFGVAVEGGAA